MAGPKGSAAAGAGAAGEREGGAVASGRAGRETLELACWIYSRSFGSKTDGASPNDGIDLPETPHHTTK